jgi:hypothetical protein
MKKTIQLLIGAGILLLAAGPVLARQPNPPAPPDPKLESPTNAPSETPTIAEEGESKSAAAAADMADTSEEDADQGGINREAIVVFGRDVELKAGDSAETVVVIGGSAKIHGKVHRNVVAIGGDIQVDGQVRQGVVAVMGGVTVGQGAKLRGDVVAVGGKVDIADGVKIGRKPVELDFGGLSVGLRQWLLQCALKLRPLAPQVGWVWAIAGCFFLVYFFIALVLPAPVLACAAELTRRPATTFFMGLLTKMLFPVVIGILVVTGIGAFVVPFVFAALMFGAIVGKVALFESLGASIGRRFGAEFLQLPIAGFLLGTLVITLFYMVPVLGLMTMAMVSVWGLGGAVTAAFGAFRRETPEKPAAPRPAGPSGSSPCETIAPMTAPDASFAQTTTQPQSAGPGFAPAAPAGSVSLQEAFVSPRATFWQRMGAGFLDIMLVSILGGLVGGPPQGFLVALAYFAAMWTWKGTTIGGIVLGLKVVRVDGQPVTFLVALVRALAAAFSIIVMFLGFLWIGWDKEKQGWHDKIAGTVVLHVPRTMALVCL